MNTNVVKKRTPWGRPQTTTEVAPGIISCKTASHGGFYVNPELNRRIPAVLKNSTFGGLGRTGWYEEDIDWSIVVYAFPEHFNPALYESAIENLKQHHAEAWEKLSVRED